MKKKQYFRSIPKDASDQQALLQKIVDEGLLPEPEETDGLVFVERVVLFTNQAIRKNSKGETQNPTRTAGTGSRDQTLVGSFQKGIDIREMPPKVIKCDLGLKLYGGFGRHEIFDDLEYEVWIYDVYRECVDTRNELQTGIDDVLEDASISDNGSFKSKPATKDDYVNILTKRINTQGWDTKKCEQWFESIEHCLNDKQISEYIKTAQLRDKADGVIEGIPQKTASSIVKNFDPKLALLNVTDAENGNLQRLLRMIPAIMNGYINSRGKTQELCAFHTAVPSHEAIDTSILAGQEIIDDLLELFEEFDIARKFYKTKPCELTKVLYQKIGTKNNNQVRTVVDFKDYDWESNK